MQINNRENNNNLTFDAKLNLRGNVKHLSQKQLDYFQKIISQIGNSHYDKVDFFVHSPIEEKTYSLIDIGGYIDNKLKAAHVSYIGDDVYGGIIRGLKYFIGKMYNNEILRQFYAASDSSEYDELKQFIDCNKIDLTKTEQPKFLHAGKLIMSGALDMLSFEEEEEIAEIVNAVAINPHDKFYLFIREGDNRDTYLINMAGYFNNVLKPAISDYIGDNVYAGIKNGIKFVIEQLMSLQIQKSAARTLTTEQKEQVNNLLKENGIELVV